MFHVKECMKGPIVSPGLENTHDARPDLALLILMSPLHHQLPIVAISYRHNAVTANSLIRESKQQALTYQNVLKCDAARWNVRCLQG